MKSSNAQGFTISIRYIKQEDVLL